MGILPSFPLSSVNLYQTQIYSGLVRILLIRSCRTSGIKFYNITYEL